MLTESGEEEALDLDRIGRAAVLLALIALLGATFGLHLLVLYPRGHVAVLYPLPVLLAAWLFRPIVSIGVAALALALHSVDSLASRLASEEGGTSYAANEVSNTLSVIDAGTDQVVEIFALVWFSPRGGTPLGGGGRGNRPSPTNARR